MKNERTRLLDLVSYLVRGPLHPLPDIVVRVIAAVAAPDGTEQLIDVAVFRGAVLMRTAAQFRNIPLVTRVAIDTAARFRPHVAVEQRRHFSSLSLRRRIGRPWRPTLLRLKKFLRRSCSMDRGAGPPNMTVAIRPSAFEVI